MMQGDTERDDEYSTIFNSRCKSLELAGGAQIFCSPHIIQKSINGYTYEGINEQKDFFRDEFLATVR